jgi:hypothetical protein
MPRFFEAKLTLDDSEGVFNERMYTRFHVLKLDSSFIRDELGEA